MFFKITRPVRGSHWGTADTKLIGSRLNCTVDTDRVGDPLVLTPGVHLTSLGARRGVADSAAN